jgi:hypothetical protein
MSAPRNLQSTLVFDYETVLSDYGQQRRARIWVLTGEWRDEAKTIFGYHLSVIALPVIFVVLTVGPSTYRLIARDLD